MIKLVAILGAVFTLVACSSTPEYSYNDDTQYCYQTTKIHTKGDIVSSEGLTECTDKPRVEHVVKDIGVASDCRTSRPLDTNSRTPKAGSTLLCKFTDSRGRSVWRPVNEAFAHPNFD